MKKTSIMKLINVFFGLVVSSIFDEECVDISANCRIDRDCADFDVRLYCPKMCHLCGECGDSRPDCRIIKDDGLCDKYDPVICRKSCGQCSDI